MGETRIVNHPAGGGAGTRRRGRLLGGVALIVALVALAGLGVRVADGVDAPDGWGGRVAVYQESAGRYDADELATSPLPPVAPRPTTAPPAAEPAAVVVAMLDNRFEPDVLAVAPGTTVRFASEGAVQHNVVALDGAFASEMVEPGAAYEARFDAPGEYEIVCAPHSWHGMQITVTVR